MNSKSILLVAASGLALSACTPNDVAMGGALKHDLAMQVVDPDPEYAGEILEGGDGVRAAAAVDRYQKGNVKQPASISTKSSGNGSGSGSGSSSGSSPN